jgi:hypothetical protein
MRFTFYGTRILTDWTRENPRPLRLCAHTKDRIAPVAIACGSADGPHLEGIRRSGDKVFDHNGFCVCEKAHGLPSPDIVVGVHLPKTHVYPRHLNPFSF